MSARPINILLVDDDEIDVMNVRRAMAKAGLDTPVWVATNGDEALDILRSGQMPAERRFLLLDLNMPRMNGIELLRVLRADPELKNTPVVVLTTSADERDRRAAYELNVAGYLIKPVQFQEFVETLGVVTAYWHRMEMP